MYYLQFPPVSRLSARYLHFASHHFKSLSYSPLRPHFFHSSFTSHLWNFLQLQIVACLCVRVFYKGERYMQWPVVYSVQAPSIITAFLKPCNVKNTHVCEKERKTVCSFTHAFLLVATAGSVATREKHNNEL